jgi:hypothetical protein
MPRYPRSSSDDAEDETCSASQLASLRSQQARIAALKRWGHADGDTSAAREKFMSRFETEADPDGTLPPEERAIRAARLKSAYFRELAIQSTKGRRAKSRNLSFSSWPETSRSIPSLPNGEEGDETRK